VRFPGKDPHRHRTQRPRWQLKWSPGPIVPSRLYLRTHPYSSGQYVDRRRIWPLRSSEPRHVFGRRGGGRSQWRTRLRPSGLPGFTLPGGRYKESLRDEAGLPLTVLTFPGHASRLARPQKYGSPVCIWSPLCRGELMANPAEALGPAGFFVDPWAAEGRLNGEPLSRAPVSVTGRVLIEAGGATHHDAPAHHR